MGKKTTNFFQFFGSFWAPLQILGRVNLSPLSPRLIGPAHSMCSATVVTSVYFLSIISLFFSMEGEI